MKGTFASSVVAALAVGPAALLAQTAVEGKVELPKSHIAPVVTEHYEIVNRGGVLTADPPRAVVWLEGNFAKPTNLPTKQVAQKDLAFVPPLLAIEVGTKVEFPNLDKTYHNIFSYSPTKRFDLGRYPPGEKPPPSVIFDKTGLVTLRCDIHEHMRGLILVLDTPYYTITDGAGNFHLRNLPAGHFVLKAWVSSKDTWERPVDLKPGSSLRLNLP
ncbi:MAG: carboxypeptidase regulatory-like domain-containing protein [Chthoniobacterales bacterium]